MPQKNILDINEFVSLKKNKDFTLIARDCIGGVLYHQLGLKFLTPTINLFLNPEDFNYFCLHLKDYIEGEMEQYQDDKVTYPVAILSPNKASSFSKKIRVDFMHYNTYQEAKDKWEERKRRINYDNLYVISSFCYPIELTYYSKELVKNWNKIKYKKMVFVDQKYGFKGEYIIKKPLECEDYAWLLYTPDSSLPWRRVFNEYDFITFLNKKSFLDRIIHLFHK